MSLLAMYRVQEHSSQSSEKDDRQEAHSHEQGYGSCAGFGTFVAELTILSLPAYIVDAASAKEARVTFAAILIDGLRWGIASRFDIASQASELVYALSHDWFCRAELDLNESLVVHYGTIFEAEGIRRTLSTAGRFAHFNLKKIIITKLINNFLESNEL